MIRALTFIDASTFTAHFIVKYRAQMVDGVLPLRGVGAEEVEVEDLPVLKEWKSARALLLKIRNGAAAAFGDQVPELGRVWVETVPPESGTPWTCEAGDYADEHLRLRIALIPGIDCYSHSGDARAILGVGVVNLVEHRKLCCEVNLGQTARTHLVVDVRKPDEVAA